MVKVKEENETKRMMVQAYSQGTRPHQQPSALGLGAKQTTIAPSLRQLTLTIRQDDNIGGHSILIPNKERLPTYVSLLQEEYVVSAFNHMDCNYH